LQFEGKHFIITFARIKMIFSDRLRLLPLSLEQLKLLAKGRKVLEEALNLPYSNFELSADKSFMEEFDQAIEHYIISRVEANPENAEWFTHWLITETESGISIGGIGASGTPDENGMVMIGYFIDRKFEGLGYATEAVGRFTEWILQNPEVKLVVADTPILHVASQKVLGNNNFVLLGEVEEGFRWQLERNS
jgi:ribosomal-protein-alanine N-acetyltransferase